MKNRLAGLTLVDASFDIIQEGPPIRNLQAALNFDQYICFCNAEGLMVQVLQWADTCRHDSALSKEFTPEEVDYGSSDESSESRKDSKQYFDDIILCLHEENNDQENGTVRRNA